MEEYNLVNVPLNNSGELAAAAAAPRVIQIDFINSAHSCDQLAKQWAETKAFGTQWLHKSRKRLQEGKDTVLTDYGVQQAINLRQLLITSNITRGDSSIYSVVFVSALRRAIETALILFGRREAVNRYLSPSHYDVEDLYTLPRIIVIPGLAEHHKGSDIGNKSVGLAALKAAFEDKGVDFSLMDKDSVGLRYKDSPKAIFGNLMAQIVSNITPGKRAAVVSHPGVMRRIFEQIQNGRTIDAAAGEKPRPDNTEIWHTELQLDSGLKFATRPIRSRLPSLPLITAGANAHNIAGGRCARFQNNAGNINFSAYSGAAGSKGGRRTRRKLRRK